MDRNKQMTTIRQRLLRIKQEINSYGQSLLMNYVDLNFIEKMEIEAEVEPAFADALDRMTPNLAKLELDFTDKNAAMEVKNAYSEALMLSRLQANLHIEKLKEEKTKTPDFRACFQGKYIYLEIKSLNMVDPIAKHKKTLEDALDKKIEAMDQIKAGANVSVTELVVSPYSAPNKPANPWSVCVVIERLIEKMEQNIKAGQYEMGDSVLLIDLSEQLPLTTKPEDAMLQHHVDQFVKAKYQTKISGELWYSAFGRVGDAIYRAPEFEGAEVSPEKLQREGVLNTHPYIKGLIFHDRGGFYGFARLTEKNVLVVEFIRYCCDEVCVI